MKEFLETDLPPEVILKMPHLNKGTAFTQAERDELHLNGLLPPHVSSIEEQLIRRYSNFKSFHREMARISFLNDVQKRNEVLFYRFCLEHCEEVLPYLYTPYVGDVSLDYSNLYAQNRGLFLNIEQKEKIPQILEDYPYDVKVIVVTDGSRILGLGDVGVGGMSIPNGKLTLYSLFGGIHPKRTLPIVLDVGTDNEKLLQDPLYIGLKRKRAQKEEYYDFLDRFVQGVKKRWPKVLLQWEDFQKPHAQNLLKKYEEEICSFNDDIQGTAAVTLAALLAALKGADLDLKDQKICIFGAGGAGTGIANLIVQKLYKENVSKDKAAQQFYLIDRTGLIHSESKEIDQHQKCFAQPFESLKNWVLEKKETVSLFDTIKNAKPTVLIGVSAQKDAFNERIIREMASYCKRPIIFPLSNPTNFAEAKPEDLYKWTQGKCIVATGSPFPDVEYQGVKHVIAQCNNVYIFPGVGLGVIASRAKKVIDEMFILAAEVLAEASPYLKDPTLSLFPKIKDLRAISEVMGKQVAKMAFDLKLSQKEASNIEHWLKEEVWFPNYAKLSRMK